VARPRKKARELTTDEAMRKLFPRKVVTALRKEAEKAKKPDAKKPTTDDNTDD
jgi:hypothetical protein